MSLLKFVYTYLLAKQVQKQESKKIIQEKLIEQVLSLKTQHSNFIQTNI